MTASVLINFSGLNWQRCRRTEASIKSSATMGKPDKQINEKSRFNPLDIYCLLKPSEDIFFRSDSAEQILLQYQLPFQARFIVHGTHSSVSTIKATTIESKRTAMFWRMLKPLA